MARVLVATFGSAGDLLPLLPIVEQVIADGHDAALALPRSLGLHLRMSGVPFQLFPIGDGSELAFERDELLFTTRFDGWASQRRTWVDYVTPTLEQNVEQMHRVITRYEPDVVVSATFAAPARIAAARADVLSCSVSIYAQYDVRQMGRLRRFALPYQREVRRLIETERVTRMGMSYLAWGAHAETVLLNDPLLLGAADDRPTGSPVGYPYFDNLGVEARDADDAVGWLEDGNDAIIVTLGSFIGLRTNELWRQASAAARECGVRALFLNFPRSLDSDFPSHVKAVGYVPLSSLVARSLAVIHHGGLGTTIGTVRGGRPSVVVPQAFDQPFNARLVEKGNLGVVSSGDGLTTALGGCLSSIAITGSASRAASQVISTREAAAAAVTALARSAPRGVFR